MGRSWSHTLLIFKEIFDQRIFEEIFDLFSQMRIQSSLKTVSQVFWSETTHRCFTKYVYAGGILMIATMKRKSHTKEKFHGLTKQLKKIAILGCEIEQKAEQFL